MIADRWRRIKELMQAALERPPGERAAFVAEACGPDSELRREVESLLSAHGRAADFLEDPAKASPLPADERTVGVRSAEWHLAVGAHLGHFEIVERVGAGGMGEVYRARDTRLGRTVAIKLVGDLAGDDRARMQLLREAQHASALNHPNICTIHEVNEADGRPFIVMELVEGRPLSALIPKGGLRLDSVIRYGSQIADALVHAHDHGIIHRDLKTSNVVITPDGRAKVLDFGLAKRASRGGDDLAATVQLTQPGTIAGTIAYMAPEVLRGLPADARSDIWALGVLIYEMTTGAAPFSGTTEYELSAKILQAQPRPLPPEAPAGVSAVLRRCLAKDPAERYQHAGEVRAALDANQSDSVGMAGPRRGFSTRARLVAGAAALGLALTLWFAVLGGPQQNIRSIAVLPFVSTGGSADTEYLSDGLTEGVINSLAQLPRSPVKVIALNSVLRYKGREIDPQAIGRDLAVQAVVVGRVVQRSDRLSVSAELVNVSDRSRMWGNTYNAGVAEFPVLQGEIAEKISDSLRVRLNDETKKTLTKRHTQSVEAYQLYLKGRYVLNKFTEEGWTQGVAYFRQALEIDPAYALAWAGLGDSYYQLSSAVLLPGEAIPKARAAVTRALEIDDTLAEAHASLGMIKSQYDWDRPGAENELRRAIELNPSYATAHHWLGQYYFANGQFEEALVELRRAQELDPFSLIIAITAVLPLTHMGRHEEALEQLRKIMEMHSDEPIVRSYFHDVRGESYLLKGMFDDAVGDLVHGYEMNFVTGGGAQAIAALTDAYKVSGIKGYWQKELELAAVDYRKNVELARQRSQARYVTPSKLAGLYVRVGDKDRAFALLRECYDHRDENLLNLKAESLRVGSPWRDVAADPRFVDLLRRIGLAP